MDFRWDLCSLKREYKKDSCTVIAIEIGIGVGTGDGNKEGFDLG